MMSGDQHAHTVILTAYDVIDDTKMVAKAIFPELLGEDVESRTMNVVAAANNTEARKTVLYLTQGLAKSFFPRRLPLTMRCLRRFERFARR